MDDEHSAKNLSHTKANIAIYFRADGDVWHNRTHTSTPAEKAHALQHIAVSQTKRVMIILYNLEMRNCLTAFGIRN